MRRKEGGCREKKGERKVCVREEREKFGGERSFRVKKKKS